MALDFITADFADRWRGLTPIVRGEIVSYAPMPEKRPVITSVDDLMAQVHRVRIWYQLAHYGFDPTDEKDRKGMRDHHFYLHRQLIMRCNFLAARHHPTLNNLAATLPPKPQNSAVRMLLESSPAILQTPCHFTKNIRLLTIPLYLTRADIRALRAISQRLKLERSVRRIRLVWNLELYRNNPYQDDNSRHDGEDIWELRSMQKLLPRLERRIDRHLRDGQITFDCIGNTSVYLGLVDEDFFNNDQDRIKQLIRHMDRLIHFKKNTSRGVAVVPRERRKGSHMSRFIRGRL